MQLGSMLESTPVGCRGVFSLSACRPYDVLFGFQVHKSLFGLCLALLVCWRRFAWLENKIGTLGFLLWFAWSSVVLHGSYCLGMFALTAFVGPSVIHQEVHGLFPLITANLVLSIRDSGNTDVWLWPLPFHVSVRAFPLVVMGISWFLHWDAHLDIVFAYCLASACPSWFREPAPGHLARVEQTSPGQWLLTWLQASDRFVCRQPCSTEATLTPLAPTKEAASIPPPPADVAPATSLPPAPPPAMYWAPQGNPGNDSVNAVDGAVVADTAAAGDCAAAGDAEDGLDEQLL